MDDDAVAASRSSLIATIESGKSATISNSSAARYAARALHKEVLRRCRERGLVCVDVSYPPHGRRISRRAKGAPEEVHE